YSLQHGGRPSDEFKTEAVKRGAEAGISKSTVEKSLTKQPDRPKITKPAKRKRQSKPEKPLEDRIWPVWQRFLKSTQWATNEVDEVKRIVHGWTRAKKAA